MRLFRYFEGLLEPTALPPQGPPPAGLGAFYWYYARQARGLVVALFAAGFIVALIDTTIPVFVGRVITLVSSHEPGSLLRDLWPPLVGMALVLLIARPLAMLLQNMLTNQAIIPGFHQPDALAEPLARRAAELDLFSERFRRSHRQRVMQTGPALRESVVSAINAVWYILVYGASAVTCSARRLAVGDPVLCGSPAMPRCSAVSAADARALAAHVGDALGPHRPHRRQLHQYPDGQTVRPRRATRTNSSARRSTSTPRPIAASCA